MTYMGIEPTPDQEDIRQYPIRVNPHTVPVSIDEPVMSWDLPARKATNNTYVTAAVTDLAPTLIVPADPRIKRFHLFSDDSNGIFVIGTQEQLNAINGPFGFHIAAFIGYPPFEGVDENLYAVHTGGTNFTLSVRVEYWAD